MNARHACQACSDPRGSTQPLDGAGSTGQLRNGIDVESQTGRLMPAARSKADGLWRRISPTVNAPVKTGYQSFGSYISSGPSLMDGVIWRSSRLLRGARVLSRPSRPRPGLGEDGETPLRPLLVEGSGQPEWFVPGRFYMIAPIGIWL